MRSAVRRAAAAARPLFKRYCSESVTGRIKAVQCFPVPDGLRWKRLHTLHRQGTDDKVTVWDIVDSPEEGVAVLSGFRIGDNVCATVSADGSVQSFTRLRAAVPSPPPTKDLQPATAIVDLFWWWHRIGKDFETRDQFAALRSSVAHGAAGHPWCKCVAVVPNVESVPSNVASDMVPRDLNRLISEVGADGQWVLAQAVVQKRTVYSLSDEPRRQKSLTIDVCDVHADCAELVSGQILNECCVGTAPLVVAADYPSLVPVVNAAVTRFDRDVRFVEYVQHPIGSDLRQVSSAVHTIELIEAKA